MPRLAFTVRSCRSIEGIGADSRPNVGSTPLEINSNWWSEGAYKMAHIIGKRKLLKGKLTFSTCRTKGTCSPFPAGIWDHHDNRSRAILFYSFVLPPAASLRCFDWAVTSTGGSWPWGETRPPSIAHSSPDLSMHGRREKYQCLNSIWTRFRQFHFWDILFRIKDIFYTLWQKYSYLLAAVHRQLRKATKFPPGLAFLCLLFAHGDVLFVIKVVYYSHLLLL